MTEKREQDNSKMTDKRVRDNSSMTDKKGTKAIVIIVAVIESVLFGMSFLGTNVALDELSPTQVNAARWSIALLVFLVLIALKKIKVDLKQKPIKYLLVIGAIQPCLYSLCETFGISLTTTSESAIILATMPVFVTLVSAVFLKIKVDRLTWAAIFVAFAGVVLAVITPEFSLGGKALGFLLLLGAVVCGGIYQIISGKVSDRFSPIEITFIMSLMGCIWFNALAFFQGQGTDTYITIFSSGSTLIAVLYLGIVCSMGCYLMLNYILANMPAHLASVLTMSLITITGVLSGVIFRGEILGWNSIGGMILILIGVVGANRPPSSEANLK